MTGSSLGIYFIQIISFFISELFIFRTYMLEFSKKASIIFTLITVVTMVLSYPGNGTEEYLLPFLAASFLCICKWLKEYYDNCPNNKTVLHNPKYAFLYGITVAFCFLTRLTNALGLCGAVLIITIFLIIKKEWKNLLRNGLMCLAGFIALILPFALYFYVKGALYDALYGTLLYNFDYFQSSSSGISWFSLEGFETVLSFIGAVFLAGLGLFEVIIYRKRKLAGWIWLSTGVFTLIWILRSNLFLHYGFVSVTYICIFMTEIKKITDEKSLKASFVKALKCTSALFIILGIIGCGVGLIYCAKSYYGVYVVKSIDTLVASQEEILSEIDDIENASFIAYNANPGVYLHFNVKPCYRFFTLQDFSTSMSKSSRKMLLDEFSTEEADWIFVDGDPDSTAICNILKEDYECCKQTRKGNTDAFYYLFKKIAV